MKLGLFAINYGTCADPASAIELARYAESAGFESVWTGEHVALPDPQPPGFSMPPDLPFLDTIVALTLIATHTKTVKVASGIIELPLRNPILLAKELASVDAVSNGRLIVGVGAGYLSQEFAAVGVPLEDRGRRMDEYIGALRALWLMERPHYEGKFVSFRGIDAQPRPVQRLGPPLVVGGESGASLRRAVTMANGWYGFFLDLPTTRRCLDRLRTIASQSDRLPELGQLTFELGRCSGVTRRSVASTVRSSRTRFVARSGLRTSSHRSSWYGASWASSNPIVSIQKALARS
jgi:probable F420-dependent oxidoreductase